MCPQNQTSVRLLEGWNLKRWLMMQIFSYQLRIDGSLVPCVGTYTHTECPNHDLIFSQLLPFVNRLVLFI